MDDSLATTAEGQPQFDFSELDAFGKLKKPGLREMLEQCDQSAAQSKEATEFEEAKPVGREFGADDE